MFIVNCIIVYSPCVCVCVCVCLKDYAHTISCLKHYAHTLRYNLLIFRPFTRCNRLSIDITEAGERGADEGVGARVGGAGEGGGRGNGKAPCSGRNNKSNKIS